MSNCKSTQPTKERPWRGIPVCAFLGSDPCMCVPWVTIAEGSLESLRISYTFHRSLVSVSTVYVLGPTLVARHAHHVPLPTKTPHQLSSTYFTVLISVSNPQDLSHLHPRAATDAAQHEIVNLLKHSEIFFFLFSVSL